MAVDLAAIRRRVQELSGQRKNSSVQLWKPEAGEYRVRAVPWKSTPDGMPFIEKRFYYLGDNPRIMAPPAGQPDPINALIRKLYSTKKQEDRDLAKKLQPKMTAYLPIIVRGQEDKGVQVWGVNPFLYQRLLGFFTDEEVGDFLDPETGFDLKVSITPSKKKFNGRTVNDTNVDTAKRSSKLHDDPEVVKKWLEAVPNIDDMYPTKTPTEIEQVLNAWLAGGATADTSRDGEARGGSNDKEDELDKLVKDVKSEVKAPPAAPSKPAAAEKPSKKKSQAAAVDLDDSAPAPKTTLDEAFEDLMEKDDE